MAVHEFTPNEQFTFDKVNQIFKDYDGDIGALQEKVEGIPDGENFVSVDQLISAMEQKADKSVSIYVTLPSSGWSSAVPYSQIITVEEVGMSTNAIAGLASNATAAQGEAYIAAQIHKATQGVGMVTFTAYGEKPTVDIPMSIIMLG